MIPLPPFAAAPVSSYGPASLISNFIHFKYMYIKHLIQEDASDILNIGEFWEANEK